MTANALLKMIDEDVRTKGFADRRSVATSYGEGFERTFSELVMRGYISQRHPPDTLALSAAGRMAAERLIGWEGVAAKPRYHPPMNKALEEASKTEPDLTDPENPEWTEEDFARAKGPESLSAAELAAFPKTKRPDNPQGA